MNPVQSLIWTWEEDKTMSFFDRNSSSGERQKTSEEFLGAARFLASTRGNRMPREFELRAAASRAYFAVHHRVCEMCTKELVGEVSEDDPLYPAWHTVYMSVNDGVLRNACQSVKPGEFHRLIAKFTSIFLDLMELRLLCDNEYIYHIDMNQAQDAIAMAVEAMECLDNTPTKDRVAFSVRIISQKVDKNEMYL